MPKNNKQTSDKIAKLAAEVLNDNNSSQIQKELAGSALSQKVKKNQTGSEMEEIAAKVLKSKKYNKTTKKLAEHMMTMAYPTGYATYHNYVIVNLAIENQLNIE